MQLLSPVTMKQGLLGRTFVSLRDLLDVRERPRAIAEDAFSLSVALLTIAARRAELGYALLQSARVTPSAVYTLTLPPPRIPDRNGPCAGGWVIDCRCAMILCHGLPEPRAVAYARIDLSGVDTRTHLVLAAPPSPGRYVLLADDTTRSFDSADELARVMHDAAFSD